MLGIPKIGASPTQQKIPLGVGVLFAETLSILYSRFVPIIIIALPSTFFIPSTKELLKSLILILGDGAIGSEFGAAVLVVVLPQILLYAATTAFIIQLTYDAKLENPIKIREYIFNSLRYIIYITVIIFIIGAILLGYWVGLAATRISSFKEFLILFPAGFLVVIRIFVPIPIAAPVIVIERSGFRGLGRGYALTRNYRWVITGLMFLAIVCLLLLLAVFIFISRLSGQIAGQIAFDILILAYVTLSVEFVGILVTLIYARLREIKEGVSLDRIDAVFD